MAASAPTRQVAPQNDRGRLNSRLGVLRGQRSSYDSHWRELARYIAPRRSRFFQSEATSAGQKKGQEIINSAPTDAVRTLSSGMMSGITSPAREWFRFIVPGLMDAPGVAEWLHEVERIMFESLARTNIYDELAEVYDDLPIFGNALVIIEEDGPDPLRAYTIPIGSYFLAQSPRGVVDTAYYETTMTVREIVERFKWERVPQRIRDQYENGQIDQTVEVVHAIEPRMNADPSASLDPTKRAWASYWFTKSSDGSEQLLDESGYHECPILGPRWSVTDNDVYGSSPGMQVLGDCKALQLYEKHKGRAIEMIVDPPVEAAGALQNNPVSLLPGEVNYVDGAAAGSIKPIVIISPQAIEHIGMSIREHEQRIRRGFFADLWLMLSQQDDSARPGQPITAREVAERHQEKMQQLGPVMERLTTELLKPMVMRAFRIFARKKLFPPPPPVLARRGAFVQPEFISIMAQALKMVEAGSIQQTVGFALSMAQGGPAMAAALDTINPAKTLRKFHAAVGGDPDMLRSDDEVAQIQQQRAQAQAQAAAAQNAMGAAQAAKDLSGADMTGDTALTRAVGGIAAAQAGGGSVQ